MEKTYTENLAQMQYLLAQFYQRPDLRNLINTLFEREAGNVVDFEQAENEMLAEIKEVRRSLNPNRTGLRRGSVLYTLSTIAETAAAQALAANDELAWQVLETLQELLEVLAKADDEAVIEWELEMHRHYSLDGGHPWEIR